jgi:transposase-like protein
MYSYEDRIRAVKLYIKLGKHTGATICQLGYPTKNSLKSWYEEYERCLDLSRGYVLSKPKYSLAQREKAVGYYLEHGRCIASTIKALGYPARDSLRDWIHELHPELHTRFVGRSDGLVVSAHASDEAGRGHRAVHTTRKCERRGSKVGGLQADLVQLEKSATRPRGIRIHETPTRNPIVTGTR